MKGHLHKKRVDWIIKYEIQIGSSPYYYEVFLHPDDPINRVNPQDLEGVEVDFDFCETTWGGGIDRKATIKKIYKEGFSLSDLFNKENSKINILTENIMRTWNREDKMKAIKFLNENLD